MGKVWVLLPAQDKWDGKADCSGARSGEVDGWWLPLYSGGTRRKGLHGPCIGGQLVVVFHDEDIVTLRRLRCPSHISANLACVLLVKRVRFQKRDVSVITPDDGHGPSHSALEAAASKRSNCNTRRSRSGRRESAPRVDP